MRWPSADRVKRHVPDLVEHARPSLRSARSESESRASCARNSAAARRRRRATCRRACPAARGPPRCRRSSRDSRRRPARRAPTSAPTCAGAANGHVTTRSGASSEDALEVERARIADFRLSERLRRPIGRGEHADHAVAGAGGIQQLGRMWREADDARRRARPASPSRLRRRPPPPRRAPRASPRRGAPRQMPTGAPRPLYVPPHPRGRNSRLGAALRRSSQHGAQSGEEPSCLRCRSPPPVDSSCRRCCWRERTT